MNIELIWFKYLVVERFSLPAIFDLVLETNLTRIQLILCLKVVRKVRIFVLYKVLEIFESLRAPNHIII